jgi:hypothetical protein
MNVDNLVTCPKCNNEIGREYEVEGVLFLDCGGVIINHLSGNCKQCGADIYWTVPNVKLERLIKKVLEGRKKYL